MKKIYTTSTYTNFGATEELNMEILKNTIKKLKPLPEQELWICKKHWRNLKPKLEIKSTANPFNLYTSQLGMAVKIVPYLKKPRIVTYKSKVSPLV
jgi:hypothetical protein